MEYEQQMTARSTEEEQVKQAIQNSEDDMIVQTIINPTSRTEKENLATSILLSNRDISMTLEGKITMAKEQPLLSPTQLSSTQLNPTIS